MRLIPALVGIVLFAIACSPSQSREPGPSPAPERSPAATLSPDPSIAAPSEPAHSGDRALAHVRALAGSIGARVAGTPEEVEAADYIAAYLESLGYGAEIREFSFPGDRFRPSSIRVRDEVVTGVSLNGSGDGAVEAPLRYVGLADEPGIAGQDLDGAIALAERGEIRFAEKAAAVIERGAIGLIVINDDPGTFVGDLDGDLDIPVVGVGQEDAALLLSAADAGTSVSFAVDESTVHARNVLAAPPGMEQCDIIVGGHYDTVPGAPGGNDNASGTANVLELARALAADGLDPGLCFAAFGAEESGLNGSRALVDELREAGELPAYMVNLDVTGVGDTVEINATNEAVAALALDAADRVGAPSFRVPGVVTNSDHKSFEDAGVPAAYLTSGDFRTIHSPDDIAADIDPAELDRIGDTAYELVLALLAEVAGG